MSDPSLPEKSVSAPRRSPVRLIVRIVLFALLGVALVALAYDQLLARPRNQQEYDKIQDLVDQKNLNPASKPITNKDVREAIGRGPSKVVEKDYYALEYYTWPRGLPTGSYYICVVYSPKDKMLLHEVKMNEEPDPKFLPGSRFTPATTPGGLTGGNAAGDPRTMTMSSGAPGGAAGPPGGARARPEGEQPEGEQPEGEQPAAEDEQPEDGAGAAQPAEESEADEPQEGEAPPTEPAADSSAP
jgi:hypothetical protein